MVKSTIKLLIAVFLCLLLASCNIVPDRHMPPSDMPIVPPEPKTKASESLHYISSNRKGSEDMSRLKTDSFVVELPLRANSKQRKIAMARFEAGRQIYNACLGEALRRRDQMLTSKMYRQAILMPHKTEEECKIRNQAFREVRIKYGLNGQYCLDKYATQTRNSWLGQHIDANTAEALATRAYRAVE